MANNIVTCRFCGEKDKKDNMECDVITTEKTTTKNYIHKEPCWEHYLADKEFKLHEKEELDKLHKIILNLHKIDIVPSSFYSEYIQGLRNGNFKMGKTIKKYKEGFTYKEIADTYLYVTDSIKWAIANKKFDGTMAELKYCLAIVVDKIQVVKKKNKKMEQKKQVEARVVKQIEEGELDLSLNKSQLKNKDKKDEMDISSFL
jgi:hypothetical protein